MAYKHGPYGEQQAIGYRVPTQSQSAIVAIGTAPVHTVEGGAAYLNKPVVVQSAAEAIKYFGYSEDWASYTLCEVINYILTQKAVGPLVLINVLDPATHKKSTQGTKTITPSNGRMVIASAEGIVLDSVTIKTTGETPTTKVKGTDYNISYDYEKQVITITEVTAGSLGTAALSVTYDEIDPTAVTDSAVIGSTDDMGLNTGIYAIKNVYALTGYIPSFIIAPGFSSHPAVHAAMYDNSRKINSHWDAWLFTDIPIAYESGGSTVNVTLATAYQWKVANGYNKENETVSFPMFLGTDGKYYHGSTLRAGNFLELLVEYNGIPYHSASNTATPIISNLWLGEANTDRIYDDDIINRYLNKNGIASAAFIGGHWGLWGAEAANYDQDNADSVNCAETNLMMLFYITNDFQHRRFGDIDEPKTYNDIQQIAAEEQEKLDGLVSAGALTYGYAYMNADAIAKSDMYGGNYKFTFDVTTTPLAKSLTALANYVLDGFEVFFAGASDNG